MNAAIVWAMANTADYIVANAPNQEDARLRELAEVVEAGHHLTMVVNGMRRGSEKAAGLRLERAVRRVAMLLLGRKLTDEEILFLQGI